MDKRMNNPVKRQDVGAVRFDSLARKMITAIICALFLWSVQSFTMMVRAESLLLDRGCQKVDTSSCLILGEAIDSCPEGGKKPEMCAKLPMADDGIVRLSKIEVYPQYLEEYIKYAVEVGEVSLLTEPGVLTIYALQEKNNLCKITILETYVSQEAYKSHIASEHFQKYKQGTLHMVKSLTLSDQTPLNPANQISNFISVSAGDDISYR